MVEGGAADLSEIEFIPHDAKLPVPLTSKIEFDQYELSDHLEIEPRNETPNENSVEKQSLVLQSNCVSNERRIIE